MPDNPLTTVQRAAAVLRNMLNVCGDDRKCQCEQAVEISEDTMRTTLAEISTDEIARAIHADDLANDRADMAWEDMHPDAIDWYESNARAIRAAILGER